MNPSKFTEEQDRAIMAAELPDRDLAENFNVETQSIRARRHRLRKLTESAPVVMPVTTQEVEEYLACKADGMTINAIAKKYKRSYSTVQKHLASRVKDIRTDKSEENYDDLVLRVKLKTLHAKQAKGKLVGPKPNPQKCTKFLEGAAPGLNSTNAIAQLRLHFGLEPKEAEHLYWGWRREYVSRGVGI